MNIPPNKNVCFFTRYTGLPEVFFEKTFSSFKMFSPWPNFWLKNKSFGVSVSFLRNTLSLKNKRPVENQTGTIREKHQLFVFEISNTDKFTLIGSCFP
ncbi:MAG: hypothetical protein R2747_03490 [Pyrinomonadaceae bacterium]